MTIVKRTLGTLSAILLTLTLALFGTSAVAAGDPGLGTDPGDGTIVEATMNVNQAPIQSDSLRALKSIRAQMYDDPEIVLDGVPLKTLVARQGLTRNQYINNVYWDTNLERSALQRAYEQNIHWGHVRPDGGSYSNAAVGTRWPGEILTTQANIYSAIADVENGSWASERDDLVRYNGAFNNDTGHLYNLINPKYQYYGFARVGAVTVGWMNGSAAGDQTGTKLSGEYTFETAVTSSVLRRMDPAVAMPTSVNAGNTGTAKLEGTGNAQTWIPSIPVSVQANYTSSNSSVLSISSSGTYRGVSGGTATVTATTATGQKYSRTVTVTGEAAKPVVTLTNNWGTLATSSEFPMGTAGDEIIVGDWNGDGRDTLGIRRDKTFYLYDTLGSSTAQHVFMFGRDGDEVLVGDWDGNGTDTLGVRRGDAFFLNNTLRGGKAEYEFVYGRDGDEVMIGNWNGTSADTISVRRGKTFYINNEHVGGQADREYMYGRLGDEVFIGDFDGDGRDTITLRRGTTLYINNQHLGGNASHSVSYGQAGDSLLMGDWNGDGIDTPGLARLK